MEENAPTMRRGCSSGAPPLTATHMKDSPTRQLPKHVRRNGNFALVHTRQRDTLQHGQKQSINSVKEDKTNTESGVFGREHLRRCAAPTRHLWARGGEQAS